MSKLSKVVVSLIIFVFLLLLFVSLNDTKKEEEIGNPLKEEIELREEIQEKEEVEEKPGEKTEVEEKEEVEEELEEEVEVEEKPEEEVKVEEVEVEVEEKEVKSSNPYQTGIASWYGSKFHGRTTANGETYNMYEMTAAHRDLPFGTMVKVVNPKNGKSVVVRINDRGPFIEGRIIDLSKKAAEKINIGLGKVHIYIVE